jgi:hypothetical protein
VVQAYCACAGNIADMMSRLTINASLEPFRAGNRLELFIDIVLAQPRSSPERSAHVHYHMKDAKD